MGRIVEFLVALNAIGGVLTFLGIRWGVRKARGKLPGGKEEGTDVSVRD
jgi:hypothetical protein